MFCNFCGTQLPDGAQVCTTCGRPLSPAQPAQQQPMGYPPPPVQQPPVGYPQPPMGYPAPVAVATKKKSKAPIIILIAVIALVVAFVAGIALINASKTVEHGVIDGNVYTNESIGITFTKPDSWTFATDEELAEMNEGSVSASEYSDLAELVDKNTCIYEMSANSALGSNVLIMIEDISVNPGISTDSYAKIVIDNLLDDGSFDYEIGETTEKEIDGQEFTIVEVTNTTFSFSFSQRLYIKKHGNYMIGIIATGFTDSSLDEIEDMISTIS